MGYSPQGHKKLNMTEHEQANKVFSQDPSLSRDRDKKKKSFIMTLFISIICNILACILLFSR